MYPLPKKKGSLIYRSHPLSKSAALTIRYFPSDPGCFSAAHPPADKRTFASWPAHSFGSSYTGIKNIFPGPHLGFDAVNDNGRRGRSGDFITESALFLFPQGTDKPFSCFNGASSQSSLESGLGAIFTRSKPGASSTVWIPAASSYTQSATAP